MLILIQKKSITKNMKTEQSLIEKDEILSFVNANTGTFN